MAFIVNVNKMFSSLIKVITNTLIMSSMVNVNMMFSSLIIKLLIMDNFKFMKFVNADSHIDIINSSEITMH